MKALTRQAEPRSQHFGVLVSIVRARLHFRQIELAPATNIRYLEKELADRHRRIDTHRRHSSFVTGLSCGFATEESHPARGVWSIHKRRAAAAPGM